MTETIKAKASAKPAAKTTKAPKTAPTAKAVKTEASVAKKAAAPAKLAKAKLPVVEKAAGLKAASAKAPVNKPKAKKAKKGTPISPTQRRDRLLSKLVDAAEESTAAASTQKPALFSPPTASLSTAATVFPTVGGRAPKAEPLNKKATGTTASGATDLAEALGRIGAARMTVTPPTRFAR